MQVYYFSRTGRSQKIAEELSIRYNTVAKKLRITLIGVVQGIIKKLP